MSEGKSKGGSCGGTIICVVTALAKVEVLLNASVIDEDAIEAAMKELFMEVMSPMNTLTNYLSI